jgi:hypothetical protein
MALAFNLMCSNWHIDYFDDFSKKTNSSISNQKKFGKENQNKKTLGCEREYLFFIFLRMKDRLTIL